MKTYQVEAEVLTPAWYAEQFGEEAVTELALTAVEIDSDAPEGVGAEMSLLGPGYFTGDAYLVPVQARAVLDGDYRVRTIINDQADRLSRVRGFDLLSESAFTALVRDLSLRNEKVTTCSDAPIVSAPASKAEATKAMANMRNFMSTSQLAAVHALSLGEEGQYFFDKMAELANIVDNMPTRYGQDGLGDQAIAHLHYFGPMGDFYITERALGDGEEDPRTAQQYQAYGYRVMRYGSSVGYIDLVSLLESNHELDFDFPPTPIGALKAKHEVGYSPANPTTSHSRRNKP